MSTVTLNYPDVIRVRRVPAIGQILILSSLALIGISLLLTVISTNANLSHRVALSQTSIAPIPVPTALSTSIQSIPSETPSPSSGIASAHESPVLPVPVPTPPSQYE